MVAKPVNGHEQALIDATSTNQLMEATHAIAQWERLSGTAAEAASFDWIEERLKHFGLDAVRYEHPALVSWPESASLTVKASDGKSGAVHCATHAFARPTGASTLEGDIVYVGRGSAAELAQADVSGKIVLVDGIIAPNRNLVVEAAGVAGSIWIAGTHLHERGLSPVWGTPTPETAHMMPTTSSISVTAEDGASLKAALRKGFVHVAMATEVFQGWKQLPLLVANLQPSAADTFVMLSGHVDSWYHGAMDNGTANATMIEVGRILGQHRDELRRGLRLAFWSGHSHARYAGSAWYADTFWQELHEHCVAHINVDSVGAKGATVLSQGNSMEELRSFVSDAIEPIVGQRLDARRYGRSGDQSFWGHGIPAALMSLSEQPPDNADPVLLALHQQISGGETKSGGLGWWWHLPDDTMDKIDPELLTRDASIYVLLLHRLCTVPVLPFDYRPVVDDLRKNITTIAQQAAERFDLTAVLAVIEDLSGSLQHFYARVAEVNGDDEVIGVANRCLMRLGRELIPVDYTQTGQFGQDLAIPTTPVPGLQAAATLSSMNPESDDYHFLRTKLIRERNRLLHGLVQATRTVESASRHLS
ncbi:MAG: M28 family metallopeptidase [Chloroflexota bacterium]|nr:M28 family metallopeptidase [Chloroflexota bacterium]